MILAHGCSLCFVFFVSLMFNWLRNHILAHAVSLTIGNCSAQTDMATNASRHQRWRSAITHTPQDTPPSPGWFKRPAWYTHWPREQTSARKSLWNFVVIAKLLFLSKFIHSKGQNYGGEHLSSAVSCLDLMTHFLFNNCAQCISTMFASGTCTVAKQRSQSGVSFVEIVLEMALAYGRGNYLLFSLCEYALVLHCTSVCRGAALYLHC